MSILYPILALLLLIYAAVTDLATRTIRNWVSLAIALLFILYAASPSAEVDIFKHMMVAGALFVILVIGFACRKVGGGDVKLASVTMLWAGPGAAVEFLVIMALTGGLLALAALSPQVR